MKSNSALFEALADVKELRKRVLDRQLFCGYSGPARIAGGCIALVGAWVLSREWVPATPQAQLVGWAIICLVSGTINLVALMQWRRAGQVAISQLRPVLDLAAPFLVGGLITFSVIASSAHDLLFPTWMWLFGLMNISSRHCLPKAMTYIGWYYIGAGIICILFLPYTSFNNPWPMGTVFFVGEVIGGIAFTKLRKEESL